MIRPAHSNVLLPRTNCSAISPLWVNIQRLMNFPKYAIEVESESPPNYELCKYAVDNCLCIKLLLQKNSNPLISWVPGTGLEPAQDHYRRILNRII